jgi:hypothetical protein
MRQQYVTSLKLFCVKPLQSWKAKSLWKMWLRITLMGQGLFVSHHSAQSKSLAVGSFTKMVSGTTAWKQTTIEQIQNLLEYLCVTFTPHHNSQSKTFALDAANAQKI